MGLQYLDSRSVVHGDLSGLNVLMHGNGRACIADFGLSMLLNELGGSTFSTSFQARGTLRWAAPELLHLNSVWRRRGRCKNSSNPTKRCIFIRNNRATGLSLSRTAAALGDV
ncbi:hypothetical protein BS17DRAFT_788969 [Gyrodon lividus]|nr:hypothetical protein BS17DRAFT_788969 [Gyrodon lividus]